MDSTLSVIIPSYNARALLRRSLRSLYVAAPHAEVIVVDGSSQDGSAAMVRSEFPSAVVAEFANHGFGHAINRGVELATHDRIMFLNSDLFVTKAAVEAMCARLLTNPSLGGVAPVLVNEDTSRQHVFGWYYWPNWVPITAPTRVPWLSAACLMTRRSVLAQVGGLDETFFLYNEEYDWCARLYKAGFRMEILPQRVVHVGGGSTRRAPDLTLEEQRGFLYLASKHAPKFVVDGLRRAMQFEGFCYSRIDPRAEHRTMWARLESITRRGAFDESPFPLSGRGTSCTVPSWIPQSGERVHSAPTQRHLRLVAAGE